MKTKWAVKNAQRNKWNQKLVPLPKALKARPVAWSLGAPHWRNIFSDQKRGSGDEAFGMSRSSFASFHLTGIKPSSGKMMTSSVDRLFESDSDVFLSNNFNEFQVCTNSLHFALENREWTLLCHFSRKSCPQSMKLDRSTQNLPNQYWVSSLICWFLEWRELMIHFFRATHRADKDSPNTSTAKSSRRDSLNERVVNAQNSSFSEPEPTPPNLYQQSLQHVPNVPMQSPPIHHMMQQHLQDMKQELPVRTASNK